MNPQLIALSDEDVERRFAEFRQTHDQELRNQLVIQHCWLADQCARRFAHRGEPLADLCQVARIALLHAVERFDPDRGVAFATFAKPTMVGEIKRHFRDHTWPLSVPRGAKDRRSGVLRAEESLAQELGRAPTRGEVAEAADLSADQVDDVRIANQAYRTAPLDSPTRPVGGDPVEGADQETLDDICTFAALGHLDGRTRRILYLRFYEDRTQRDIGERIGVGQVQISRLIRAALDELRDGFVAEVVAAAEANDGRRPNREPTRRARPAERRAPSAEEGST